jgi:hypothetical protein
MKPVILAISFVFIFVLKNHAQTWQSIPRLETFETAPLKAFKINPYTNDIWIINDTKVAVIENNGNIQVFTSTELGPLWENDNIQFAFTPSEVYYNITLYGLHSFTGFASNVLESTFENYLMISSNLDTIYVTMKDLGGFKKYYNGITESYSTNFTEIDAKNSFVYGNNGGSGIYQYFQSTDSFSPLMSDPDYLYCLYNDTKFSRNTDTFYVASVQGISYANNYDFLGSVTPINTFNMPTANVLEIEFDHLDSLWAVFGDVNGDPFAIAKLEGDTWTNIFDAGNSPIDFSSFLGLEIDTLGNLWVADGVYLHSLLSPNSPDWLGLNENNPEQNSSIYPNPSSQYLTVSSTELIKQIEIIDLFGRSILVLSEINAIETYLDLSKYTMGNYIIKVSTNSKTEFHSLIKK